MGLYARGLYDRRREAFRNKQAVLIKFVSHVLFFLWLLIKLQIANKSNSFKYIWNKAREGSIIGCIFRLLVNGPLNRGAYELSVDTFVA